MVKLSGQRSGAKYRSERMKKVISAGIIIYRRAKEELKFLLLYHGHGYWNFPKGKIESEERSWQTALREVREETGIKPSELKLQQNFKVYERFFFRRGKEKIFKIVIFYLAETRQPKVVVSYEHEGYGWFSYDEAKKVLLKYKDSMEVLRKAHELIRQKSIRKSNNLTT